MPHAVASSDAPVTAPSGPALQAAVLDGLRTARFTCTYSIAWHLLWTGRYLPHIPGGRYLAPGSVAKAAEAVCALIASGAITVEEVAGSFDAACQRKGCPSDTSHEIVYLTRGAVA